MQFTKKGLDSINVGAVVVGSEGVGSEVVGAGVIGVGVGVGGWDRCTLGGGVGSIVAGELDSADGGSVVVGSDMDGARVGDEVGLGPAAAHGFASKNSKAAVSHTSRSDRRRCNSEGRWCRRWRWCQGSRGRSPAGYSGHRDRLRRCGPCRCNARSPAASCRRCRRTLTVLDGCRCPGDGDHCRWPGREAVLANHVGDLQRDKRDRRQPRDVERSRCVVHRPRRVGSGEPAVPPPRHPHLLPAAAM